MPRPSVVAPALTCIFTGPSILAESGDHRRFESCSGSDAADATADALDGIRNGVGSIVEDVAADLRLIKSFTIPLGHHAAPAVATTSIIRSPARA
ncbi:MAG: hypothetical protein GY895_01645 [Phycisphaera sp.]|nr:hypothetical protein [Phycisphaera sp.]